MTSDPTPGTTADMVYSPDQLRTRSLHRRAVEAVIWGMPAVNFELMWQAFEKAGGGGNQVAYWSRLLDWKDQTLTPNPDTIYINPFYDTSDGPIVLEIPAKNGGNITGSVDCSWQNALEDVGPAGVDKGAGGKYLILPPGHDAAVPEGYIALPSDTWRGFAVLRSNPRSGSDADVAEAVAYGKRVRIYPLAQAASPPETRFVDLLGTMFDATIPYDARFFGLLANFVAKEPWLSRDRAMIDPLRSIGIEKGKPFAPDEAQRAIFDAAAAEAGAAIDLQYQAAFDPPFFPGTGWAIPAQQDALAGMSGNFPNPDEYPIDGRAVIYSMAYFSARHLGAGQYYLLNIRDGEGQPLDGSATYRLTVPPDAPVDLYWSVTAYDRETHTLIRDVSRASRASTSPGIETNADGSVDIWFAPQPPAGKDANWVPTATGHGFELLFRLYGVRKSFFDKNWVLPNPEKAS